MDDIFYYHINLNHPEEGTVIPILSDKTDEKGTPEVTDLMAVTASSTIPLSEHVRLRRTKDGYKKFQLSILIEMGDHAVDETGRELRNSVRCETVPKIVQIWKRICLDNSLQCDILCRVIGTSSGATVEDFILSCTKLEGVNFYIQHYGSSDWVPNAPLPTYWRKPHRKYTVLNLAVEMMNTKLISVKDLDNVDLDDYSEYDARVYAEYRWQKDLAEAVLKLKGNGPFLHIISGYTANKFNPYATVEERLLFERNGSDLVPLVSSDELKPYISDGKFRENLFDGVIFVGDEIYTTLDNKAFNDAYAALGPRQKLHIFTMNYNGVPRHKFNREDSLYDSTFHKRLTTLINDDRVVFHFADAFVGEFISDIERCPLGDWKSDIERCSMGDGKWDYVPNNIEIYPSSIGREIDAERVKKS